MQLDTSSLLLMTTLIGLHDIPGVHRSRVVPGGQGGLGVPHKADRAKAEVKR